MTSTASSSAPMDVSITALFPGAGEAAHQNITKRDLKRRRVSEWRRRNPVLRIMLWVVFLGGIAGGFFMPVVFLMTLAALITWIFLYARQSSEAADDLFNAYATARGLTWSAGLRDPSLHDLPLLQRGDKRAFHRVAMGAMIDTSGSVSHYTYTEISTDSEGNRTETDYHFTLVHLPLPPDVASRYPGVYVRKKGLVSSKMFDRLTHDRKVELESAEFRKRYSLRVVDQQDDVALYELMSTSFIQHLADAASVDGQLVQFEQRSTSLMVYVKSHLDSSADMDALVAAALPIYRRYREEYQ